jgi:hypothetical protein
MLTFGTVEVESPDVVALGAVAVGDEVSPMRLQAAKSGAIPTTSRTCLRERMAPSMERRGAERRAST